MRSEWKGMLAFSLVSCCCMMKMNFTVLAAISAQFFVSFIFLFQVFWILVKNRGRPELKNFKASVFEVYSLHVSRAWHSLPHDLRKRFLDRWWWLVISSYMLYSTINMITCSCWLYISLHLLEVNLVRYLYCERMMSLLTGLLSFLIFKSLWGLFDHHALCSDPCLHPLELWMPKQRINVSLMQALCYQQDLVAKLNRQLFYAREDLEKSKQHVATLQSMLMN